MLSGAGVLKSSITACDGQDGRSDYSNEAEINFFARRLLLEMTEENIPLGS